MKRTPLRRRAPLRRKVPLQPDPNREAELGKDFTQRVRREIAARSNGRCEIQSPVCIGTAPGTIDGRAMNVHHRKRRRHGDHSALNGAHSCIACHPGFVHSSAGCGWAREHGLLIKGHEQVRPLDEYPLTETTTRLREATK